MSSEIQEESFPSRSIDFVGQLSYNASERHPCREMGALMTFGEKLRQLRERADMTQEQLAAASGVNLWTIRGYEQGRREPNWKGLIVLARALGVPAEEFADCNGNEIEAEPETPKRPRRRAGTEAAKTAPRKPRPRGKQAE